MSVKFGKEGIRLIFLTSSIKESNGKTTIVTLPEAWPSSGRAGNWYVRDLPPPVDRVAVIVLFLMIAKVDLYSEGFGSNRLDFWLDARKR